MSEGGAAPDRSAAEKKGWTFGRVAAIAAFVVIAGFWAWALSPLNNPTHPDELDDTDFREQAEARCAVYVDDIDDLPKANTVDTPPDRAPLIDQGTQLTVTLVEDLSAIAPPGDSSDGEIVLAWFADWEVYIADRDAYAEALLGGETGPFAVSARDGEQITEFIDAFATVNGMASCVVPLDV